MNINWPIISRTATFVQSPGRHNSVIFHPIFNFTELKRYSRLSSNFSDFVNRKELLFDKVLTKGYALDRLNQIYNLVKFDSKS